MRSHISRVSIAGALLFALGACSDATNGLPPNGAPNGSGGGPVVTTGGVGTAPANTVAPKLIDDGTVAKGKYAGFNAPATDTQSPLQSPADATKAPTLPNPPSPGSATDAGSHAIAFSGNGSTQVILAYGGTVPNLTYSFGNAGNNVFSNYGTIALHAAYVAGATTPGTLASIAVELAGGTGAAAYDVRVPCTLPTGGLPAAFGTTASASLVTCTPLPVYPIAGFTTTNPNTLGPNAVSPGVTGQFTPMAPKLYLVLTYAAPSVQAGTATLSIDDLYARQ